MTYTFRAILPVESREPGDPRAMRDLYWPLDDEKANLKWENLIQTYDDTLEQVVSKGCYLRVSVIALMVEVTFLILWLLVTNLTSEGPGCL